MGKHWFKVGEPVHVVGPYEVRADKDKVYRIREVGICNMYRLDGLPSWLDASELAPCAVYDAPFREGDMVVRVADKAAEPVAQKVSEVDGAFIRLFGSPTFEYHEQFKKWKRPEEVIVIRMDGDTTRAYLKRGGKIISEAKCRRMHDDEHDLKIVSALALDRLLPKDDREIVVREDGYYGAVAVSMENPYTVRSDNTVTAGLIMEFFGGKWKDAPVFSKFCGKKYANFLELKEDFAKHGYTVIELHR